MDLDGRREWPVNPNYNGFSRRHENNFRTPNRPNHNGIDINFGAYTDDLGAPVYATHDGKIVTYIKIENDNNAGGNRIQIRSENGEISTYYMHLNTMVDYKVGDFVFEGDLIGTIGGSGKGIINAFAPHLHYELKIDGQNVNPAINSSKLIDPQKLIMPVHMGTLSPAIIEGQGKVLRIDLPQKLLIQNQETSYEKR